MKQTKQIIIKYPLYLHRDPQPVHMPAGAKLLTVQMQGSMENSFPSLWATVDATAELMIRELQFIWSGFLWASDTPSVYVGTVQDYNNLVWHLFDYGETSA